MVYVFWICAVVIAYVYAGYPALLALGALGRRRRSRVRQKAEDAASPLVSVIVAAHNEESVIEAKIANVLASQYPNERLELLIGSDGSSDRTEEIVRQHSTRGVGLVSFPQQQGKSAIQNGLVALASGSVLVFSDADCAMAPGALRAIVENFRDSSVGLVTAMPRYINEGESAVTQNESAYLRYESWIRQQESSRGLLAVASGSLFAVQRDAWRPLDRNLGDDFELPLRTVLAGRICVADASLGATTRLSQSAAQSMFRLKARIVSKDFRALMAYCSVLNPLEHGAVAIGLWSHKLLRWLVPCFLIAMLVCNLALLRLPFYRVTLALQIAFYALAAAGSRVAERRRVAALAIPFSFCLVNCAALVGVLRCLSGRTAGAWTPVRGESASI